MSKMYSLKGGGTVNLVPLPNKFWSNLVYFLPYESRVEHHPEISHYDYHTGHEPRCEFVLSKNIFVEEWHLIRQIKLQ